jgi:serine/threonine protein phosphatase PrpC
MTDTHAVPPRKPRDEEIDVWGLTHVGKVRQANEDHFLIGSLKKQLVIKDTSIPESHALEGSDERIAFLAMIADGVGGRLAGEEASRMTLEEITQYVAHSTNAYYEGNAEAEGFIDLLQAAASRSHERIKERAKTSDELRGMATTLTLFIGVWPWVYLLQVGDSRYYNFRDGTLTQVTRDQTMAQELVDQGVMTRSVAFASRWANVLSSSIGGEQTAPVVTRIPNGWDCVHLLCSDGLTKHVSDEQIAKRIKEMTSAKQCAEALLQDALDGGGTDNITVIVGRRVQQAGA